MDLRILLLILLKLFFINENDESIIMFYKMWAKFEILKMLSIKNQLNKKEEFSNVNKNIVISNNFLIDSIKLFNLIIKYIF